VFCYLTRRQLPRLYKLGGGRMKSEYGELAEWSWLGKADVFGGGEEGTLFQCHFMNHKSYTERVGTETGD